MRLPNLKEFLEVEPTILEIDENISKNALNLKALKRTIKKRLQESKRKIITIYGFAGMGKTVLDLSHIMNILEIDLKEVDAILVFDKNEKLCALVVKNGNELINKGYANNIENVLKEIPVKNIKNQYLSKILLIRGKANNILGNWEIAKSIND